MSDKQQQLVRMDNPVLQIEKGIPIPKTQRGLGTMIAFLRTLKTGDSFLYPLDKRCSLLPSAKRLGIKITTRKLNKEQIRVWRIE